MNFLSVLFSSAARDKMVLILEAEEEERARASKLSAENMLADAVTRLRNTYCPIRSGFCFSSCSHWQSGAVVERLSVGETTRYTIRPPRCKLWFNK